MIWKKAKGLRQSRIMKGAAMREVDEDRRLLEQLFLDRRFIDRRLSDRRLLSPQMRDGAIAEDRRVRSDRRQHERRSGKDRRARAVG